MPHDAERVKAYLARIRNSLKLVEREAGRVDSIPTVYFGGGTPSVLGARELDALVNATAAAVDACGSAPLEWTVELNPEDVDTELINRLKTSPVNRLSLGVQSFNFQLRRLIGRGGSARAPQRAAELIAERWPRRWSIDLISGVPGQSEAVAVSDVRTAASLGPEHLSIYPLSIEPGTPLAGRAAALRGGSMPAGGSSSDREDDEGFVSWLKSIAAARNAGYERYEVSNFALPGFSCLHNCRFWAGKPYIGIGPSAVSTLWGPPPYRVQAPPWGKPSMTAPTPFMKVGGGSSRPPSGAERLASEELWLEYLMLRLRTVSGLDLGEFRRVFDLDISRAIPELLASLEERALIHPVSMSGGKRIQLSDRGFIYLDAVLREVVSALSEWRLARAEPHHRDPHVDRAT